MDQWSRFNAQQKKSFMMKNKIDERIKKIQQIAKLARIKKFLSDKLKDEIFIDIIKKNSDLDYDELLKKYFCE